MLWPMLVTQHYSDVTIGTMASQITSLAIVCSTVYSSADQRKYQSSASMAFVRGIHRWPVNSPHKWPVTRKMFPFDDVIMNEVAHVIHMELRESTTCACYIYIYIKHIYTCAHINVYVYCILLQKLLYGVVWSGGFTRFWVRESVSKDRLARFVDFHYEDKRPS